MKNKILIGIVVFFLVITATIMTSVAIILITGTSIDFTIAGKHITFNTSNKVEYENEENVNPENDIVNNEEIKEEENITEGENNLEVNTKDENEEVKEKEENNHENSNPDKNIVENNTSSNEGNKEVEGEKISDNWFDGEFLYNDVKINLISNFSELQKNIGLKFDNPNHNNYYLDPNFTISSLSCNVGKRENIIVGIKNSTKDSEKYTKCDVNSFSTNVLSLKKNNLNTYSNIKLSKGINWNSKLEDITKAYGEPQNKSDNDKYSILQYIDNSTGNKLELTVYKEYGLVAFSYSIKK